VVLENHAHTIEQQPQAHRQLYRLQLAQKAGVLFER
jgi:hypothetical protein